jgi:hypothetical protein
MNSESLMNINISRNDETSKLFDLTIFSVRTYALVTHYCCVSKDVSNGQAPCTGHLAALTLKHKIYLCFSVSISLFLSFSLTLLLSYSLTLLSLLVRKTYCNDHKMQNQKTKLCVPTGHSPLQCPWVLSISGKEVKLSADCQGCCVRFSRPRPRPGRPACLSIVIFYRPTPCSPTSRRCYRRQYSLRTFNPCIQTNL